MTYAQLDDHFDIHPKYEEFDLEHYGLQGCAITHCNRHLTDGRISLAAVRKLGKAGPAKALKVAAQLVAWGIWRATATGFEVVGFLDHNPSREQVEKRRSETKARKDAWKERQERKENTSGTRSETRGERPPTQILSSPIPSDPLPEKRKNPPVGGAGGLTLEPTGPKPKKAPKGKTTIPDDFTVSPAIEAICRAEGLPNPHEVFVRFRDSSKATERKYADWEAGFRNWMRSPITAKDYTPWREIDPTMGVKRLPPVLAPPRAPRVPTPEQAAALAKIADRFRSAPSEHADVRLPEAPAEAAR